MNTVKTLKIVSGAASPSYGIYFPNILTATTSTSTVSYDGKDDNKIIDFGFSGAIKFIGVLESGNFPSATFNGGNFELGNVFLNKSNNREYILSSTASTQPTTDNYTEKTKDNKKEYYIWTEIGEEENFIKKDYLRTVVNSNNNFVSTLSKSPSATLKIDTPTGSVNSEFLGDDKELDFKVKSGDITAANSTECKITSLVATVTSSTVSSTISGSGSISGVIGTSSIAMGTSTVTAYGFSGGSIDKLESSYDETEKELTLTFTPGSISRVSKKPIKATSTAVSATVNARTLTSHSRSNMIATFSYATSASVTGNVTLGSHTHNMTATFSGSDTPAQKQDTITTITLPEVTVSKIEFNNPTINSTISGTVTL